MLHNFVNINVSNDGQWNFLSQYTKYVHQVSYLTNQVKEEHFWSMHLCCTTLIKLLWKKWLYLPNALFAFNGILKFEKGESFNLAIAMEGITHLLWSNFEWRKCKWGHKWHAFAKLGCFFLNMSITDTNDMQITYLNLLLQLQSC